MQTLEEILDNPSTSYWLKGCLKTAAVRDPVGAVNDAQFLLAFLNDRLNKIRTGEL